MTISVEH